jgi:hypothetical protein
MKGWLMPKPMRVFQIIVLSATGIWLLNGSLAAQSPVTRRITLEEAQEQSSNKMADVARYTMDVAKYAR